MNANKVTNSDESTARSKSTTETAGAASVRVTNGADFRPPIVEGEPKFEGTDVAVENLFRYLDNGWNLHVFLSDFPSVSLEQAVAVLWKEASKSMSKVVHSNRKIVGGTPVFKGTRLPVKSLFDYMAGGYSLDAFLHQFPSLSEEQAIQTLHAARQALENQAYEHTAR